MTRPTGRTVFQTHSKNGPIAVQNFAGVYKLVFNGTYTHSIYDPVNPITNKDYWDYLLLGRAFLDRDPEKMCILGLGGGTAVNLFNRYFPPKHIDGVEIDPKVVKIGKKYFGLNVSNLTIHVDDAKEFINKTNQIYDLIIVDVFKPTGQEESCNTEEFYSDVKTRLNNNGVVVVNHFDTTNYEGLTKNFGSIFRVKIHLNQVYYCQKN